MSKEIKKYKSKPIKIMPLEIEAYQIKDTKDICTDIENTTLRAEIGDYIIIGKDGNKYVCNEEVFKATYEEVVENIKEDMGEISDGYHTFNELYYHRMILFSIICNTYKDKAWKSWKHYDGTMYEDYFIVGITTDKGDYTYHYHKDYWDMFKVTELDKGHKWDGHKPEDITRLLSLIKEEGNKCEKLEV